MSDAPYIHVNGQRVVSLDLAVPFYGIPVADIAIATGAPLPSPLSLTAGNLTLAMAVGKLPDGSPAQRSFAGTTTARLVGGAGSWGTPVSLTPYNSPGGVLLSKVLTDLATATGTSATTREKVALAAGLDRSLGTLYVPETGAPASRLLSLLAGALWWMDTKGVTQVAATRPTTTVTNPATVTELSGAKGWVSVATEDPASWLPGATYTSATVTPAIKVAASRFHAGNDGALRVEVLIQ